MSNSTNNTTRPSQTPAKKIITVKKDGRYHRDMESLALATNYVKTIEDVQGVKISVPEEIAYYNQWIDEAQLLKAAEDYGKSPYGDHLRNIAEGNVQTTYNKKAK